MKTYHKLPFSINSNELLLEFNSCIANWISHFNTSYYKGEWSGIPLRSPKNKNHQLSAGDSHNDDYQDEAILKGLPYTRSVLNSLKTEKFSVRYLRLTPGSEIKAHKDHDMIFWDGYIRLHIPIITNDDVAFKLGDEILKMKPGELWFADFSQTHSVINRGKTDRVHLVIDCSVNDWIKSLFEKEGIIQKGETKPNPIDSYSKETKLQMIQALLEMNTETSIKLAQQMTQQYSLS